jgi:transaldolase
MKFFIDTANINEIKEALSLGLVDGVTTNPTLIAKEGKKFSDIIPKICELVNGPISVEVLSQDSTGMTREAREYSKINKNIVIKVPLTREGLKVINKLSNENIKTNATLVFSPTQSILAAKAGATFVSPFVGRLDDISHYGMESVSDMVQIYKNYNFKTEIIVASIRNPLHVIEAAKMGAHIATIPFNVIEQLVKHPLTDIGVARFLKDWEKVPK